MAALRSWVQIWIPPLMVLLALLGSLQRPSTVQAATGDTIYALTTGNVLLRFSPTTPNAIAASATINGLQTGEVITGIDFRPLTGELFGLGIVDSRGSDTGRLYRIDTLTGAATCVAASCTPFSTTLADNSDYGFDFNPTVDRIRVVNSADQNFRLNPDTGLLAGTDVSLDDPTSSFTSAEVIGAVAYDRNDTDTSTNTTLFGIDFGGQRLVLIGGVNQTPSPNGGVVTTVGPLGVVTQNTNMGFDVASIDGLAYAALRVGGQTGLYRINLATGAASLIGPIGDGAPAISGLAVARVGTVQFSAATYSVGEAGGTATITVNRVGGNDGAVQVSFATSDGTATAGADYGATAGTLTFPVGSGTTFGPTGLAFTVPILNDILDETNETVNLTLSNPTGGVLLGSPAAAVQTIEDDDPPVVITVAPGSRVEGNAGVVNAELTVSLSLAYPVPISVSYATVDGTAQAGLDYSAANGTLQFAPGETSKIIQVPIVGDTLDEPDETFTVNLSGATNAVIGVGQAVVTIVDDDADVALTVARDGTGAGTVTSTPAGIACGSDCSESYPAGTAVALVATPSAGSTFAGWGGGCTGIGPCVVTLNAALTISATFIADVPPPPVRPSLTIDDLSVIEGQIGTSQAVFTVLLSAPSSSRVTARFRTVNLSARAGRDYLPRVGLLTIPAGKLAGSVVVPITGDTRRDRDRQFRVVLSAPRGATLARASAIGTIVDDDGQTPRLVIGDARRVEGQASRAALVFPVLLTRPTPELVTVDFDTADVTARASRDYDASRGQLTLPRGSTRGTIIVPILGDRAAEPHERFRVVLTRPSGAVIADGVGVGTILNDD